MAYGAYIGFGQPYTYALLPQVSAGQNDPAGLREYQLHATQVSTTPSSVSIPHLHMHMS
jgi:hypothetical protein